MVTFTFNGWSPDWIQIQPNEARWMAPLMDRNEINVPGMHGALKGKFTLRPRVLQVPVGIWHDGWEDLQNKKIELGSWLITQETGFLAFSDEPDIIYHAVLSTPLSNIVENHNFTTGVLEFTCHDPFRYANSLTAYDLFTDGIVRNYGSAPTHWNITVLFIHATNRYDLRLYQVNGAMVDKRIVLNWNFQAGDVVHINSATRRIEINGVVQMTALAFMESEWFNIEPGENTFHLSNPTLLTFTKRWF